MPHPEANPGVSLGLILGSNALAGRDKLTFVADPEIASFGSWAEQLIAESTGKHGVGIVPVDLEPLGRVDAYGAGSGLRAADLADSAGPAPAADGTAADDLLTALEAAGHPVVRIALADPIDLAVSSSAGRSRPRSPGSSSGSIRSTSRTSKRPRSALAMPWRRSSRAGRADGPPGDAPVRADDPGLLRRPFGPRSSTGPRLERLRRLQAFIAPTPNGTPHCPDPGDRARSHATGDDRRLRPALPPLDRPAPQGRPADRLVPPADRGPSRRPADPRLAVHVRPAHRRPGAPATCAALRAHDLPVLRIHLGADPDAGLAALERALAAALKEA